MVNEFWEQREMNILKAKYSTKNFYFKFVYISFLLIHGNGKNTHMLSMLEKTLCLRQTSEKPRDGLRTNKQGGPYKTILKL